MKILDFSKNIPVNAEVFEGVKFTENKWTIQYEQSEHISFNFNFFLGRGTVTLLDFPDLLFWSKALTYYAFPQILKIQNTSWRSVESTFNAIKMLIIEFLYPGGFISKHMISLITPNQLKNHITQNFKKVKLNNTLFSTTKYTHVLAIWEQATMSAVLPTWACMQFRQKDVLSDILSKEIYLYNQDKRSQWQPLPSDVIERCFNISTNYLNEYATAIIDLQVLIRQRPRWIKKGEPSTLKSVRQDGETKHLFKKLATYPIPNIVGSEKKLLNLKIETRKVKTLGYKCGWQYRTIISIDEVRPQVINLKRSCIFIIGLFTGMRRREISELKVGSISSVDGQYYLQIRRFKPESNAQVGCIDSIPVPTSVAVAVSVLERLFDFQRQTATSDYLLLSDIPSKKAFKKIKISTIGKDIKRFCKDFSGYDAHSHQLRKTISWLLISRSEANIDLIRQLFGHKSYGMSLRYILRNSLMVRNVIELLEHNYTQDLQEALANVIKGVPEHGLEDAIRKRGQEKSFKGQLLVTDIASFINETLASGVPLYISRIPIGGFCMMLVDGELKTPPPCMKNTNRSTPSPDFCNYLSCPHVLFTQESNLNIQKQIDYYLHKLDLLPDNCSPELVRFYTKKVKSNQILSKKIASNLG
jgi:integrase